MSKHLCIHDQCKRCDIGYLIKDYMKPLMQALTVQIREYNMRLYVPHTGDGSSARRSPIGTFKL